MVVFGDPRDCTRVRDSPCSTGYRINRSHTPLDSFSKLGPSVIKRRAFRPRRKSSARGRVSMAGPRNSRLSIPQDRNAHTGRETNQPVVPPDPAPSLYAACPARRSIPQSRSPAYPRKTHGLQQGWVHQGVNTPAGARPERLRQDGDKYADGKRGDGGVGVGEAAELLLRCGVGCIGCLRFV